MKAASAGAAVLVVSFAGAALAQDAKHDCVTSAYDGQKLRDGGDLAGSRSLLLKCVATQCPSVVVNDCSTWLAQVEARLPTVVLAAHDTAGRDVLHVRVSMDGKEVASSLDGMSVAINPGPHTFSFVGEDGAVGEASIIAHEGEKSRIVSATLAKDGARGGGAPSSSSLPIGAIVVASVGVAALASFAGFGIAGQNERSTLESTCAASHSCSSSDVNSARDDLLVADVSLGVGVALLGVATYLWVTHRASHKSDTPTLAVVPLPGGVSGMLRVTF
jgi:hypothetical protein